MGFGGFQQSICAVYIRIDKIVRRADGAIHVAFCSKVRQDTRLMLSKYLVYKIPVTDIALYKVIPFGFLDIPEIFRVSGIREFVQVHDTDFWIFIVDKPNIIAADKPAAASNEKCLIRNLHRFLRSQL
ncbi:MAG: hypothetical protein MAGBODY4_00188 [Candidatus Marinimicrobia bacterium]|nr:hypothetical protein [Candidatus Neomarinimicrobiota bacterium]